MEDINNSDFSETDEPQADDFDLALDGEFDDPEMDNVDPAEGDQDDDAIASDEDAKSEAAPEQTQEQEAEPTDPVLFVDTDGTEITRSYLETLKSDGMRQPDYTRKTQELATQRRETEAFHTALQQREMQAQQEMDLAIVIAQQRMPQQPNQDLLNSPDPADRLEYHNQMAIYNGQANELQRAIATRDHNAQQAQKRQAHEQEQMVQREVQAMHQKFPEFRDPVKLQEFQAQAVPTVEKYGFTAQELSEVYDHRLIGMIKELAEYHQLKANKPKAQAKANGAPPVKKPGRQRTSSERSQQDKSDLISKLRQTGSERDFEALLD